MESTADKESQRHNRVRSKKIRAGEKKKIDPAEDNVESTKEEIGNAWCLFSIWGGKASE